MRLAWLRLISMAAVAPLAVTVNPAQKDSAVTSLSVALGGGSYAEVARGCEGNVIRADPYHFRDAGVTMRHEFPGPAEVGLRATVLRRMPGYEDGAIVWNPYVALEGRVVGVSAGFVPNDPELFPGPEFDVLPASGHLRLGSRDKAYFSIHVSDDAPIASNGGMVRAGLGLRPSRILDIWLGGGGIPQDKVGLITRADLHVHRLLDLNATGRLGGSEGISENAGTVGMTLKFPWRRSDATSTSETSPTIAPFAGRDSTSPPPQREDPR